MGISSSDISRLFNDTKGNNNAIDNQAELDNFIHQLSIETGENRHEIITILQDADVIDINKHGKIIVGGDGKITRDEIFDIKSAFDNKDFEETFEDTQDRIDDIQRNTADTLRDITNINQEIAQISFDSSRKSAKVSLQEALFNQLGLEAQLKLSALSTKANNLADTELLATRYALGLASKAQEIGVLIAQYREKTFNLMAQVEEQRNANTWARVKRLSQSFKW